MPKTVRAILLIFIFCANMLPMTISGSDLSQENCFSALTMQNTDATLNKSSLYDKPVTSSVINENKDPITIQLSLSKFPKAGENADLKCIVSMNSWKNWVPYGTGKAKIWIEVYWTNINGSYQEAIHSVQIPLEDVLVRGDTSWEGDFIEKGRIELRSQIKLPMEGVWRIKAFFSSPNFLGSREEFIYFAIVDGNAIDLRTHDYKSGPYAYLGNLGYGTAGNEVSDKPINILLDISKAPRLGEEATITCHITSVNDVPDYSAKFMFHHITPEA